MTTQATTDAGERTQEHTPGPWRFNDMTTIAANVDGDDFQYAIQIARILPTEPRMDKATREANAKLIAAAPETQAQRDALLIVRDQLTEAYAQCQVQRDALLAALREVLADSDAGNLETAADSRWPAAHAAIARAEAKSPDCPATDEWAERREAFTNEGEDRPEVH